MHALLNNTKWEELRLAMYNLADLSPRWRTLDVENGYLCDWDREWSYHFKAGGYKTIQWVDIETVGSEQTEAVQRELVRLDLPGERTPNGFRVYGYVESGKYIQYIGRAREVIDEFKKE
jgi:hypothetical protein